MSTASSSEEDSDDEVGDYKVDDREWGNVWKEFAQENHCQDIESPQMMRKYLKKVKVNLTVKSCQTLMLMSQKNMKGHVHLTTIKEKVRKAVKKNAGLPVDQAIGGLIIEWNNSAAGRRHKNTQSVATMNDIVNYSAASMARYTTGMGMKNKSTITAAEKKRKKEEERKIRALKRAKALAKQQGKKWVDPRKQERRRHRDRDNKQSPRREHKTPSPPPSKSSAFQIKAPKRYRASPIEESDGDTGSVVVNPTPKQDFDENKTSSPAFPTTYESKMDDGYSLNNMNTLSLKNNIQYQPRLFGSENIGSKKYSANGKKSPTSRFQFDARKKSAQIHKNVNKNNGDKLSAKSPQTPSSSTMISGGQEIIEIVKRQENMLYRIQTQVFGLDGQIKLLFDGSNNDNELKECLHELEYLKTSSMAELSSELSQLKMDLFDGFESISISSAYELSTNIRSDLHSMNNTIDRTVRLWGNDWNVKKRVLSNQQKLDKVLFRAEKVLRKYNEMQSNIKSIRKAANNDIAMNIPQFISEMDTIRQSLKSMDHYLSTFVFDRLSRMENALVRIFEQSSNLSDPTKGGDDDNNDSRSTKRFSVDELMNQLDSQRLNFEGELQKKSKKIQQQKQESEKQRLSIEKERIELRQKIDKNSNLKGKYELEQAKNKELEFELKQLKSQLQRLSTFTNTFGTGNGNGANNNNDDDNKGTAKLNNAQSSLMSRMATVAIHPDIAEDEDGDNMVDLSLSFDRDYSNSLSKLIGEFISKSKLENKEKANEFIRKKERGHVRFRKDELPNFLAAKNRDAQQQELEDRLGFGYEELYYLYRENTELNVRNNRLENENKALRKRLKSIEPVIIVENLHNVQSSIQRELKSLHEKLRNQQSKWKDIEDERNVLKQQRAYIDKYRIEMLHDSKKIEEEINSQMNYDKFQFQRQRKKMNALMKSEKEGVLKERDIMEQERAEIDKLAEEWKEKLNELEKKEADFDQKVHLAKSNMNEVVFQKGLTEHLKEHLDDLKEELREKVDKEAVKEETESIRTEFEETVSTQREYYTKRYEISVKKHDKVVKECDALKLQITHLKKEIDTIRENLLIEEETTEKIKGQYDTLENEYNLIKQQYKELQKKKGVIIQSNDNDDDDDGYYEKKKKRKGGGKKGGKLPWLDVDSDDDEITKLEKESIKKWLIQRHGAYDTSPNHNQHWLQLPQDKLAGLNKDIEDLKQTIKTLKQELDTKNNYIGLQKVEIAKLRGTHSSQVAENYLLKKVEMKQLEILGAFKDDINSVKKWLQVWEDGIKTVTKAEHKWTMKHSELVKKEKEIAKEREDLLYDQRMWYAHKNHILRRFYYFTKQVWWERFVVHEFQKSRVDQEMKIPLPNHAKPSHHMNALLWNQYYKMILEAWFETGVYQHALTRWFCQFTTLSTEKALFYYGDNDNNEELYIFKDDVHKKIKPHLNSIIERYYRNKWRKRKYKFGRCWIEQEKPLKLKADYHKMRQVVKDLFTSLHAKEPSFNKCDIKKVIERVDAEMNEKISKFSRAAWDVVKFVDGVGVVSNKQQQAQLAHHSSTRSGKSTPRSGAHRRLQARDSTTKKPSSIKTNGGISSKTSTPGVSTPKRMRKKVRIAQITHEKSNDDDGKDENKEDAPSTYSLDEELLKNKKNIASRKTLKTPKAGNQLRGKTWSHATDQFKSPKKQIKKMTNEERQKLKKKRQQRHQQQQQQHLNGNNDDKEKQRRTKSSLDHRTSVKNKKISPLTEKHMD